MYNVEVKIVSALFLLFYYIKNDIDDIYHRMVNESVIHYCDVVP